MPKFFIPLHVRYGDDEDPYSHLQAVYGPYESDTAVEEALSRLWPNKEKEQFLVFEGQVVSVKPSAQEKPESEKRAPGNMDNYVQDPDGKGYKCKDCQATILGAQVAHPVRIKGMMLAGSGEVRYSQVPYCPNCDREPNFHGSPVYEEM